MKALITLMTLVFSLTAVAGPEEHMQAQTCYYLIAEESSPINNDIPTQICLESLTVDTSAETISIYSYFYSDLYKNLKLNYIARKNEDSFSFRASNLVRNDIVGTEVQKITLFISGRVDNQGEVDDLEYLTISLEQIVGKTWAEAPIVKNIYKYRTY